MATGKPAWTRQASIYDYDGALDKTDCTTETVPYAWVCYQDYTGMIGDAFTVAKSGVVHAKKLALARCEAAKYRTVERAICNSVPNTADECLGQWAKILNVAVSADDPRGVVRQKCAARFGAIQGATVETVDESLSEILGDVYVESIRQNTGPDISTPPGFTYWPGENPGPPAYSLGGGTWLSPRAHLIVRVVKPNTGDVRAFLRLVNVDLFDHLNRLLPSWETFSWTTGTYFYLDISQLDYDGLSDP